MRKALQARLDCLLALQARLECSRAGLRGAQTRRRGRNAAARGSLRPHRYRFSVLWHMQLIIALCGKCVAMDASSAAW